MARDIERIFGKLVNRPKTEEEQLRELLQRLEKVSKEQKLDKDMDIQPGLKMNKPPEPEPEPEKPRGFPSAFLSDLGKVLGRSSLSAVESITRDPTHGERVGRPTTGKPIVDKMADVAGGIIGPAGLYAMLGTAAGALSTMPVLHAYAPSSPVADAVVKGMQIATAKHALQSLSAPEGHKPTESDVAKDLAFHGITGPASRAVGSLLPDTMEPLTAAAIRGAGGGLISGAATAPFLDKEEDKAKYIAKQMAIMALFNVGELALRPGELNAARAAREKAISDLHTDQAALRRFGVETPGRRISEDEKKALETELRQVYRHMSKTMHPDVGGTREGFEELTAHRDRALRQLEEMALPRTVRSRAMEWIQSVFGGVSQTGPAPSDSTSLVPYQEPGRFAQSMARSMMPRDPVAGPEAPVEPVAEQEPSIEPADVPQPLVEPTERPFATASDYSGPRPFSDRERKLMGLPTVAEKKQPITPQPEPPESAINPANVEQEVLKAHIDNTVALIDAFDKGELGPDFKNIRREDLATNLERIIKESVGTPEDAKFAIGYLNQVQSGMEQPIYSEEHPLFNPETYQPQEVAPTMEPMEVQETPVLTESIQEPVATEQEAPQAPLVTGRQSTVYTDDNSSVDTVFAVVDARDLVTSHDTDLRINPSYPQELQPRDRSRSASELQVNRIASKLQPERLGDSAEASTGAPIVGPDMIVESGNGRVIALNRLAISGHANWDKYKQWLAENAEQFGITSEQIQSIENPVLVRVRQGDVDRVEFTGSANMPTVAQMSASELAVSDAKKITPGMVELFQPGEQGHILTMANQPFITRFFSQIISPEERGSYLTRDGSISQAGVKRIENAMFAYAYGEDSLPTLERLAEDPDSNVKNITGAMLNVSGKMADVNAWAKGKYEHLAIANDMAVAAGKLSQLRFAGETVEEFLIQAPLFQEELTDEQKNILAIFDRYKRSRKALSEIFAAYSESVLGLEHPDQVQMFGSSVPTKNELLQAAINLVESDVDGLQVTLWGNQSDKGESIGESLAETLQREETEPIGPGTIEPPALHGEEEFIPARETEIIEQPDEPVGRLSDEKRKTGGEPLGIVPKETIMPGTFRPIDQVTGRPREKSLLSYEYDMLPPSLRAKVEDIDNRAAALNYRLQQHQEGTDEYRTINEQLAALDAEREELTLDVTKAMNTKGPLLQQVKNVFKSEMQAVEKGDLHIDDFDASGEPPEGVAGYVDGQPIFGRLVYSKDGTIERFLPPIGELTEEDIENIPKQVNSYLALLGLPKDLFPQPMMQELRSAATEYMLFLRDYIEVFTRAAGDLAKDAKFREEVTFALEGKTNVSDEAKRAAEIMRKEFYGSPNSGLFKEFGIDPIRYVTKYSPRANLDKDYPITGTPTELYFWAEMQRTGNLQPREKDFMKLANAYLRSGAKKKFFGPIIEKWAPVVKQMDPTKQSIHEDLINLVLGRPTKQDRFANDMVKKLVNPIIRPLRKELGDRPAEAVVSWATDLVYAATMGGNPFSIIVNSTQQLIPIYLVDANPIKGWRYWGQAKKLMSTEKGQELLRYCHVGQDREYLAAQDAIRMLNEAYGEVLGNTWMNVKEKLFAGYQWIDRNNVHTSYLMGVLKALDEGKSMNDAVAFGNQLAADTQWQYGIDTPPRMRGAIGKAVFMFNSWQINFMRMLWKAHKEYYPEDRVQIGRILSALAVSVWLLSKATGLDLATSTGPASTFGSWTPVKAARGELFSTPLMNVGKDSIELAAGAAQRLLGNKDEAEFKRLKRNWFRSMGRAFVPGSTQGRRIIKFVDAALDDWWAHNTQGKRTYRMGPGEATLGLVGPTLASKQTLAGTKRKAIDAYMKGDMTGFRRANEHIAQRWGPDKRVTQRDINREMGIETRTAPPTRSWSINL